MLQEDNKNWRNAMQISSSLLQKNEQNITFSEQQISTGDGLLQQSALLDMNSVDFISEAMALEPE